ncbi:glycosyl hydrolase family 18 protein [Streptomyces sp. NPDC055078]
MKSGNPAPAVWRRAKRRIAAAVLALALPLGLSIGLDSPAIADGPSGTKTSGAKPGAALPTAPGDLRAVKVTDTSITLAWSPSYSDRGIARYRVDHWGTSGSGSTTELTYTDTGLNVATEYHYQVAGVDNDGQSGYASRTLVVRTTGSVPPMPAQPVKMAVFAEEGNYQADFHAKDLVTSGAAGKLTHLTYGYGRVTDGQCSFGDRYTALEKSYPAERSVNGKADTWDQPVRGHLNQLAELKKKYPGLRILWSFGGKEYSHGFLQSARNPAAFAESCARLVNDPRWAGLFDGIDLSWVFPEDCGVYGCQGPELMKPMVQAFRTAFGNKLVTATFSADRGARILDAADLAGMSPSVDWFNIQTYDHYKPTGRFANAATAPGAPLYPYQEMYDNTSHGYLRWLTARQVHPNKLVFGIPSHAWGWQNVTTAEPGRGGHGPAPGDGEPGRADYRTVKVRCPATGTASQTAYGYCGTEWWTYDTPATVAGKMAYAKSYGLGGAFLSDAAGDTADGELVAAIDSGLR